MTENINNHQKLINKYIFRKTFFYIFLYVHHVYPLELSKVSFLVTHPTYIHTMTSATRTL